MKLQHDICWTGPSVTAQFESAASSLNSQQVAIVFGSDSITYKELNERVNKLANYLSAVKMDTRAPVSICLERSIDSIVAILSVLKSGAPYVPLDPTYPRKRLSYMLKNSGARIVITQSSLSSVFSDSTECCIIQLDRQHSNIDMCCGENPPLAADLDLSAYIIYTSGSTGKPKGAVMSHRAVSNLIKWQLESSRASITTKTGQFSPLSFDVSFQEIFSTLCSGGVLVILSEEQRRDPFAVLEIIHKEKIQRMFMPFVSLQQLAESAVVKKSFPPDLREIITAGEQLVITDAVREFFSMMPDCELFNHYGPSETHVVTCHRIEGTPSEWPRLPPIGHPILNVQLHVLDENQIKVKEGECGELYIAGSCLADGYVNNADLTKKRFIDSLPTASKARVYRTGDIARITDDGVAEFLGRIDQQIKIRGHRIEPGEIESILSTHSEVSQVAIIASKKPDGEQILIGCIVPIAALYDRELASDRGKALIRDLTIYLKSELPTYMIPSHFRFLSKFPLTPSGKLDRKALAKTNSYRTTPDKPTYVVNRSLADSILVYWQYILEAPDLKMSDSVFDLGATSISVPTFQNKLLACLDLHVPAAAIYQHPSSLALAEFLQNRAATNGEIRKTPKTNTRRQIMVTKLRNKRRKSTVKASSS